MSDYRKMLGITGSDVKYKAMAENLEVLLKNEEMIVKSHELNVRMAKKQYDYMIKKGFTKEQAFLVVQKKL